MCVDRNSVLIPCDRPVDSDEVRFDLWKARDAEKTRRNKRKEHLEIPRL